MPKSSNTRKVAAVTAALLDGPYRVEPYVNDSASVLGPNGEYFKDAYERRLVLSRLDAEKIVRLYNEDAHRDA